ncbi:MAG: hypothetical protein HYU66_11235 [Armatimonadetes bacterium]|nr:hypothetical protein [Armatimonadota bacterium]
MALLLSALAHAHAAPSERLLVYKVERIDPAAAPHLDGRLDEPCWQSKATIATLRNFLGPLAGELSSQGSEFVLLTDGRKLYLGATFHDSDMAAVRYNPGAEPFWNDCAELYFDPRGDGTRQIQLVVDCGGTRWWQKQVDNGYGWWEDRAWSTLADWDAAAARGADAWTIELVLDCASFGIDPRSGGACGFNACRFRLGGAKQEFSAWGYDSVRRQKAMRAWGHLLFGAPGQAMRESPLSPANVRRIYPSLEGRVLEVPRDTGFDVFDEDGVRRVSFAELAAARLKEVAAAREACRQAVAGEPEAVTKAEAEADALAQAAAGELTMGAYDRLADAAQMLAARFDELRWRAKLEALVRRATASGGGR